MNDKERTYIDYHLDRMISRLAGVDDEIKQVIEIASLATPQNSREILRILPDFNRFDEQPLEKQIRMLKLADELFRAHRIYQNYLAAND